MKSDFLSLAKSNFGPKSDGRSHAKICTVCGKEGAGIAIRDHLEANHLEGIALPCNDCGKVFRSRAALRKHNCLNRSNLYALYYIYTQVEKLVEKAQL